MTDLHTMLSSLPLKDCKKEIQTEVDNISLHTNEMKKAIIGSFLLDASLKILNSIDFQKFLLSLKNELSQIVDKGEEWKQKGEMLSEHLEKNREVIAAFESGKEKTAQITKDIEALLRDYDEVIRDMCLDMARKSIAEIEAHSKKN